jgi:hypothetical protein
MRKLFLILIFFSTNAMALEAVVTVLETPLFKTKNISSKVVQYLRKGDVIKIHPSVANNKDIEKYAPSPEKLADLNNKIKNSSEYKEDPLFRGEAHITSYIEDEFIPTLDRQGNISYVLSSHIYVYFNDKRELEQKTILARDPTDYRLEEPLPENYPLKKTSGFRGQFILGVTQPHYESYNYPDSFKTKGYSSPMDVSYTVLRQAHGNYQERLFLGGSLNFRHHKNTYTFNDNRQAIEQGVKFGLGPTISYDAFKGERNRINLSGTVLVNFFDRLYLDQRLNGVRDNREYIGYSITHRLSIQYHRKRLIEDLDLVLGTSLEIGAATSFRAKNAGTQSSWWQNIGDDKFTTRTTFTLGGYVGLQTAY